MGENWFHNPHLIYTNLGVGNVTVHLPPDNTQIITICFSSYYHCVYWQRIPGSHELFM